MKLCELLLQFENRIGGLISVEPMCVQLLTNEHLQLPTRMTLHNHDFCRFIKQHDRNDSCAHNKHYSVEIASRGRRFCGYCPYGVWELVQPVMFQQKLAAVLYFGGFCDVKRIPSLEKYGVYRGSLPPPVTPEKIVLIKKYAAFMAEFIRWELELALAANRANPIKQHGADYYLKKVTLFLAQHFSEDIRLADVAELCHLTPNYLSNLLRKHTGKTFRQLLLEQRLIEAEACLKYRHTMSITDIAMQCGFCDGNYFSAVFHRAFGCSPRYYRLNWRILHAAVNSGSNQPAPE